MPTARPMLRAELADFLRRRREALSPAAAGLPAGTRRRTPGLRRDEVAGMAHMSANYYERLERGRGPQPSETILAGLADALRLGPDERDYLFRLGGRVAPPAARRADDVDDALLSVLAAVDPTAPAFICDDIATVLAQNDLHVALFGSLAGLPGLAGNMIWRWFSLPQERFVSGPAASFDDTGHGYVADLRAILAQRHDDPAAVSLVADLRATSAEFRDMWDQHRVSAPTCPTVTVEDERVGRLDFTCTVLIGPQSRQRLAVLHAVPGTGTRRRLTRLVDQRHRS